MGYFSNGTEGLDYEMEVCARCAHGDGEGAGTCVVWFAHLLKNYDECNNKDSVLHILIPRSDNGRNERCRMFLQAPT